LKREQACSARFETGVSFEPMFFENLHGNDRKLSGLAVLLRDLNADLLQRLQEKVVLR
jgi:hypothetical protein